MTNYMEGAKPSPRVANGNLYWYEGDTFSFPILINLQDTNGYDKRIQNSETVVASFYNNAGVAILTKEYTNIENNTIILSIDRTETAKFQSGRYVLKMRLKGDAAQATITNHIDVIVQ